MEIFEKILAELRESADYKHSSNVVNTSEPIELFNLESYIDRVLNNLPPESDPNYIKYSLFELVSYLYNKHSNDGFSELATDSYPLLFQKETKIKINLLLDSSTTIAVHKSYFNALTITSLIHKVIEKISELKEKHPIKEYSFNEVIASIASKESLSRDEFIKQTILTKKISNTTQTNSFFPYDNLIFTIKSNIGETILPKYKDAPDNLITASPIEYRNYIDIITLLTSLNVYLFLSDIPHNFQSLYKEETISAKLLPVEIGIKEYYLSQESGNQDSDKNKLHHTNLKISADLSLLIKQSKDLSMQIVSNYIEDFILRFFNDPLHTTHLENDELNLLIKDLNEKNFNLEKLVLNNKKLEEPHSRIFYHSLCITILNRFNKNILKTAYDSKLVNEQSIKSYMSIKFDMVVFMEIFHIAMFNYVKNNILERQSPIRQVFESYSSEKQHLNKHDPFTKIFFGLYAQNGKRLLAVEKANLFSLTTSKSEKIFATAKHFLEKLAHKYSINKADIPKDVLSKEKVYLFLEDNDIPKQERDNYDEIINYLFPTSIDDSYVTKTHADGSGEETSDNNALGQYDSTLDIDNSDFHASEIKSIFKQIHKATTTSKGRDSKNTLRISTANQPFVYFIFTFYFYDYKEDISKDEQSRHPNIEDNFYYDEFYKYLREYFYKDYLKYLKEEASKDKPSKKAYKEKNNIAFHVHCFSQRKCFDLEEKIFIRLIRNPQRTLSVLRKALHEQNATIIKIMREYPLLQEYSLEEEYSIPNLKEDLLYIAYEIMFSSKDTEVQEILQDWKDKNSVPNTIFKCFEDWLKLRSKSRIAYLCSLNKNKNQGNSEQNSDNQTTYNNTPTYSSISSTISRVNTLIRNIAYLNKTITD